MDNTEELLSQLRDIHLPAAINAWPWASGRYLILILIFLLFMAGAFFLWRYRQGKKRRAVFLGQLRNLEASYQFAELSTLLKRVALYRHPKANVASLQGEAWLAFLDQTDVKNAKPKFQSEIGRLLLDLPYSKLSTLDLGGRQPEALAKPTKDLLQREILRYAQDDVEVLNKIIERWLLKNYV